MPGEVSLAKQLSGSECLDATMAMLRNVLAKDDRFASHVSYDGYRAVLDFRFYPHRSFAPDVERVIEVAEGEQGDAEPEVTAHIELPVRPPNQVREEAGMPTPVLVTENNGQSHESWKKTGNVPKQNTVPKNKVKGI